MSLLSTPIEETRPSENAPKQSDVNLQGQIEPATNSYFASGRWVTWVALGAATIASLPYSIRLWKQLWATEQYSFFPIVFIAAAAMLVERVARKINVQPILQPSGLLWLGAATVCLGCSFVFRSPWLGWVGMLLSLRAAANLLFQVPETRALRGPWLLLWLTLPLPFGLDSALVVSLQKYASASASSVLDSLSIPNILSGVTIRTPQRSYMVETACSGINSFYACLALVAVFAVWKRYSLFRSTTLLFASAFWTVVFNTIRVVAIVYSDAHGYGRIDVGTPHDILGVLTFCSALLATLSFNSLLCYVVPLPTRQVDEDSGVLSRIGQLFHTPLSTSPGMNILFGSGMLALVLGIGAIGYANRTTMQRSPQQHATNFSGVLPGTWGKMTLPSELDGWTQTGFKNVQRNPNDPFGANSLIWEYRKGLLVAEVSIDGPYGAWHDLWYCYSSLNWNLHRSRIQSMSSGESNLQFTHLWMHRNELEEAHVWFACFDSLGSPITPPPASNTVYRQIINRFEGELVNADQHPPPVYQCQVYMQTITSPLPVEIEMLESLASQIGGILRYELQSESLSP